MSAKPAVQERMSEAQYRASTGLSYSALKDLAISPLRFWYWHINPDRPTDEPTREMVIGSALHCRVLQPKEFERRYAKEFQVEAHHLVTMDHLREWLRDRGETPKGTTKDKLVSQVHAIDPSAPVADVLREFHKAEHDGKKLLKADDWQRIESMAASLLAEPKMQEILSEGEAEVPLFVTDSETGVVLKGLLDWVAPTFTADLKTFTQKREKSIDKSIADAIWYEKYHWQAWWYANIRREIEGVRNENHAFQHIIPFVESDEPHEVRIRVLRPKLLGEVSMLWETARRECRDLIRLYAECLEKFGDKPWRDPQKAEPLYDQDVPGLPWS